MNAPNFPKTPVGTTDWEQVFENAVNGFVPQIERAETPEALRATCIGIAKKLFSRFNDDQRLGKFLKWIDKIVPEGSTDTGNLPRMKESLLRLMRQVEAERMRKAAEFVAHREAKGEAFDVADRRHSKLSILVHAIAGDTKRRVLLVAFGLAGMFVLGTVLSR